MSNEWHGYIGIEALSMTAQQRQTLVAHLRSLGPASDGSPARLNHLRARLDSLAAIFEAAFDDDSISAAMIRNRLATIYGVAPETITYATQQTAYGPMATYTYGGTARLRLLLFGGIGATRAASRDAAAAYLAANSAAWEASE